MKSLSIPEWIALGTFALLALEMALIRAQLVRGHYAWRDTHASVAMARDVGTARSLREALAYVFGPPGWRPDGNGPTASNIRRAAASASPSGIAED
jgi:hypothetical protein